MNQTTNQSPEPKKATFAIVMDVEVLCFLKKQKDALVIFLPHATGALKNFQSVVSVIAVKMMMAGRT